MPYSYSGTTLQIYDKTVDGLILTATVSNGTPPTTASIFCIGARVTDLSTGTVYVNQGSSADPTWIADNAVRTVVATTNGTTAVNVFGSSGAPTALTITGVYLISLDTTAGNITVESPAATVVCTIAKGTTAGALVGATTLADTDVAAGDQVVVDSSSAGNAQVYITYVVA